MILCPFADWRGPVPNNGGPRDVRSVTLGVLHVMQGSLSGTDAWFHNPLAQVSAHFGLGQGGEIVQWVPIDETAWAEADFNRIAISIECEGVSGDELTSWQYANLVRLVEWCDTWVPLVRGQPGWVGHGELGAAGGDHPACPGPPILAELAPALAQANPFSNPQPQPQGDPMQSETVTFAGQVHLAQVAGGILWHKWLDAEGWHNEALAGPLGTATYQHPLAMNGAPKIAVLGSTTPELVVTAEASDGHVWYFAQSPGRPWGVNQCP